jgi:hypothetical protein
MAKATTENPTPEQSQGGAASTSDAAPATSTAKKPVDPAKREAAAKRAAVRNLMRKAGDAQSVDELWSKLDALRGKTPEKKPENGAAVTAEVKGGDMPKGFPSPDAVADVMPSVLTFWGEVEEDARGTIFELPEPTTRMVRVPVSDGHGGWKMERREVVTDPIEKLAEGTAPLAAKFAGKLIGGPWGLATVAILGVFRRPLLTVGVALGRGIAAKRRAAMEARAAEQAKSEERKAA